MFRNEKKQSQINVLRNFLKIVEQDTTKDSITEDLERLINSKTSDLEELRKLPRTNAFGYDKDTPELIQRIAYEAFDSALDRNITFEQRRTEMNNFKQNFSRLIENPEDCDTVRFCDECGSFMFAGYVIDGGSEYYCSDECLHQNYTADEYAMLCCDLSPGNKEDEELFSNSSEDELEDMRAGSETYYTEWEI